MKLFKQIYILLVVCHCSLVSGQNTKTIEEKSSQTVVNTISPNATKTDQNNRYLSEPKYKDKVIGSFGGGFRNFDKKGVKYTTNYGNYGPYQTTTPYTDEYFMAATQLSNNRWWINKYLVGGLFCDFGFGDYINIQMGSQITFLADFDAVVLPYTSFGTGLGINNKYFYIPLNYRLGSYFFFQKKRGFGIFAEYNVYLNNATMPYFRVGITWTRLKSM